VRPVAPNGTEIDVLRVTAWHEWVVRLKLRSRETVGNRHAFVAKHGDRDATSWLTSGYDDRR
jgi:hypothetical protein